MHGAPKDLLIPSRGNTGMSFPKKTLPLTYPTAPSQTRMFEEQNPQDFFFSGCKRCLLPPFALV